LAAAIALSSHGVRADEDGVSFWLPGQFGSLAAAPQQPGWSFAGIYYHTSVSAGSDVATAREIAIGRFNPTLNLNLSGSLHSNADLALGNATYVFASPVLGGQAALGLTSIFGRNDTSIDATVTGGLGPFGFTRSASFADSLTAFGDLYPMATLRWNQGVNNYMVYATADLPAGAYDPNRLSNLGIGHWAIDSGAGYTYFDPQKGHEFSAVAGFTYNFINPYTQYQNGVDFHVDWGSRSF
jgi:hypothetical protein